MRFCVRTKTVYVDEQIIEADNLNEAERIALDMEGTRWENLSAVSEVLDCEPFREENSND